MTLLRRYLLGLVLALAACGPVPDTLNDAGEFPDAGLQTDSGVVPDAGDAGEDPDAGQQPDAGEEPDAGQDPDAGWLPAPETSILSGPPALSPSSSAQFTFSSVPSGSSFECALDGTSFAGCSSPLGYTALDDGPHTFAVRAVGALGAIDPSPANHAWTVDTTPPDTTLTSTAGSAFTFTSDDASATFECALDGAPFAPCTSPLSKANLSAGDHTFEVRAVDLAGNVDPSPAQHLWTVAAEEATVIRVMAANTTSGNLQSYDPGHGKRIFQGLDPDIVLIQEFNFGSNSPADIRRFVDETFGPEFFYYREGGAQIPNGVISRYPIIASGEWTDAQVGNRDFAWARIDIPGPKDLWAVSVHLLTRNASVRNSEASSLVGQINTHIPEDDYLVLGGDFNTDTRTEPCISTFSQVVVTSNAQSPWPTDHNGNGNTNASRSKPYDWLLADPDLYVLETPMQIGGSIFPNGIVFDSRVYSPLSEVAPVLSGDSSASNMQHMAVAKDFLISP